MAELKPARMGNVIFVEARADRLAGWRQPGADAGYSESMMPSLRRHWRAGWCSARCRRSPAGRCSGSARQAEAERRLKPETKKSSSDFQPEQCQASNDQTREDGPKPVLFTFTMSDQSTCRCGDDAELHGQSRCNSLDERHAECGISERFDSRSLFGYWNVKSCL